MPRYGPRVGALPHRVNPQRKSRADITSGQAGRAHTPGGPSGRPVGHHVGTYKTQGRPPFPRFPVTFPPAFSSKLSFWSHYLSPPSSQTSSITKSPLTSIAMASRILAPKMASMVAQTSVKAARPAFRAVKPQQVSRFSGKDPATIRRTPKEAQLDCSRHKYTS